MATTEIEKVLSVFAGINAGEVATATRYFDQKRFVQHNPYAAPGLEGLAKFIRESPRDKLEVTVIRAFQDGPYVVTHAKGQRSGRNVFFDIFRFEDNVIVEHWAFSAPDDAPPNQSGHTQTDGPTEVKSSADTEANKSIVQNYYQTIHVSGDHGKIPNYFSGDHCIRHEPGVRDGVSAFQHDLAELIKNRTIDQIKFVFGQGDFVFIAAKGSHQSKPCIYLDLYRVENGKIAERWGFPEEVPPEVEWKNHEGML